ncbi:MAG: putative toxin-antitoxin system toxin component, PIN family [Deltaproteobacteria bacterium]|nr:putative toxin-antitoxin system toxin component, PIN family [Deltaproteobacteria bacterium]
MRLVLDTNVLVSGLLTPKGSPGRVVDGILLGDLVLVVDDRILEEYREVLARPKFGFDVVQRERLLVFLRTASEQVVAPPVSVPLPDPDDLPFLEAALHAGVALVTGNARHFPIDLCRPVEILGPAQVVAAWAVFGHR